MPLRLLVDLDSRTQRQPLREGVCVVGSGAPATGVDLRLKHPSVSRRHARLVIAGETLRVEDLGSSNGTWVDGRRIGAPVEIGAGAGLRFGAVEARVESVAADDLEAAVGASGPRDQEPPPVEPGTTGAIRREFAATAQSTAALAPAQAFLAGELPVLLAAAAAGGGLLEHAQRAGAALFRSLPCLEVEILDRRSTGGGLLFQGRRPAPQIEAEIETEAEVKDPGQWREAAGAAVLVRARFFQRGVARAAQPVLESLAHLLDLTAAPARSPRRPPAGGATAPPLPDPPTLDAAVARIYDQAARIAQGSIGILVRGESGTGKEVLADFLHRASRQAEGPFVALNCAALPDDLLEAELFGIERGVATGVDARAGKLELAHGGTLFLDEVGDMAPATQAKILRTLQEGEVYRLGGREPRPARMRVISATHRDLDAMLASGDFRADLYHRIAGWEVTLPPLRRRRADIANLAAFFLDHEGESLGIRPAGISRAAVAILEAFPWPGNIRQLQTEIARAALFLGDGDLLDTSVLSPRILAHPRGAVSGGLKGILESVERDEIELALRATGHDVPQAAERLGLPLSTLYRRIKALGLGGD